MAVDVREKLADMLIAEVYSGGIICDGDTYKQVRDGFIKIADHLIAHGVTLQEWISVKERSPEKDGHYLCNYHFGEYPKMTFTQVLDYYATDIVPHFQHTLGDGSMKVTHWMEIPKLPQPPKGE